MGFTRSTAKGIEMRVHPTLIPEKCLIANVDGVMNAVLVQADMLGQSLYYGAGAGSDPTASAVVADIIDVTRSLTTDLDNRVPHLAFQPDQINDTPILPMNDVKTSYYLRLKVEDKPGVMAEISEIMGNKKISIEAILQTEPVVGDSSANIIMLTQRVFELQMDQAISEIIKLKSVSGNIQRIRVENLQEY